ncbi:hypothetical protein HK405_014881, partial [Cladochytrium tenue]
PAGWPAILRPTCRATRLSSPTMTARRFRAASTSHTTSTATSASTTGSGCLGPHRTQTTRSCGTVGRAGRTAPTSAAWWWPKTTRTRRCRQTWPR